MMAWRTYKYKKDPVGSLVLKVLLGLFFVLVLFLDLKARMGGLLAAQCMVFMAFVVCVPCCVVQAVAKKLFAPSWYRAVCVLATEFLFLVVLWSTVPGRTRHLDFAKQQLTDAAMSGAPKGGGSELVSWLGTKFVDVTTSFLVQSMRFEQFPFMSIGFMETESGWRPVSVGFAGIVCNNFFYVGPPAYETPLVNVELAKDPDGARQLVFRNNGAANYTCAVCSCAGAQLCEFDLDAHTSVRVQQEKAGWRNKISKLKGVLKGDKSLVFTSESIEPCIEVSFKSGKRVLKRAVVRLVDDGIHVAWKDPE